MTDDIALILIKRIESLEEQVAELKAAKPKPLEWPVIDLSHLAVTAADRMGFEPFALTERN